MNGASYSRKLSKRVVVLFSVDEECGSASLFYTKDLILVFCLFRNNLENHQYVEHVTVEQNTSVNLQRLEGPYL